MLNKTNIQTAMRGAVILLLAWGAQSALAGPNSVKTPPDAATSNRYLPPTVAYPSGLDTSTVVTLPDPESSHGKGNINANANANKPDKTNSLPVKPVNGPKNGKASVVTLDSLDVKN